MATTTEIKDTGLHKADKLMNIAIILSIITILYNLAEGGISIFYGLDDETLSLLGFGIDSFVEVSSGIAIAHMILRMRHSKISSRDKFERQALRVTGAGFYILTLGLIAGSILNIIQGTKPETTFAGIIIAAISIVSMYFLTSYKLKIGKELKSDPIIADANCTRACLYLSVILLAASGLYEIFRVSYIDVAGSLAIAWFTFKEGRESFAKAKSRSLSCCGDNCHSK